MSQQIEIICRRCERRDILDHEPPEDYVCSICGMPAKPVKFENRKFTKDKPYQIKLYGWWKCGKHNQTWKKNQPCLDCEKEPIPPAFTILNQTDKTYEKILGEIDLSKTESGAKKRIKDHLIALNQAQLDTPILLKEFIAQQTKQNTEILKQLKQLNKNLEGNNED